MSKAKFAAAKEMIDEQNYAGARAILSTIDHPTARTWEQKLNQIAPTWLNELDKSPPRPVERKVIYVEKRSNDRSSRGCLVSVLLIIGGIIVWLAVSMGVGYIMIGLGILFGLIAFIIE